MRQAVDSFGSEGLRIVSLVIGFSIVQLVLLLAAFRSRRQNVNHLIAFVFVFTGFSGLLVAVLTGVKERFKDTSEHTSRVVAGVILVLFVAMVVVGFCFYYSIIRIPFGQVAVSTRVPREGIYSNKLRTIAYIDDTSRILNYKDLYDRGYFWFIDFVSSQQIENNIEFILSHPDAIFFAVGSSRDDLVTPPNLFRLMNRDSDQIHGVECETKDKNIHVVRSAADMREHDAKGVPLFLDVGKEALEAIVKQTPVVLGDLWVSQSAAFSNPSKEVWEFLQRNKARMIVSQTSALVPFTALSDILIEEAMLLVYESILSKQEELKTHVDVIKFISNNREVVPFDSNGDRDSENRLMVVRVSDEHKWVFEKKVSC